MKLIRAWLEPSLGEVAPESRFQFERHGYFVADRIDSQPGKPVFNRTVTLKGFVGQERQIDACPGPNMENPAGAGFSVSSTRRADGPAASRLRWGSRPAP